jgi:hypothetical protein
MERARLEDATAATILQVEEHGYLEEAEVLRRFFHFRGIGFWAEARYSSPRSATLRSNARSPPIQVSELSRQTPSLESRFRSVSERQPTPYPNMENETMQETERPYRAEIAQSTASTAEDVTALSSLSAPTIGSHG